MRYAIMEGMSRLISPDEVCKISGFDWSADTKWSQMFPLSNKNPGKGSKCWKI
jgi:hypothetical protein